MSQFPYLGKWESEIVGKIKLDNILRCLSL